MSAVATPRRLLLLALVLLTTLAAVTPSDVLAKRAPEGSNEARLLAVPAPIAELEAIGPVRSEGGIQRRYGTDTGVLRRFWRFEPSTSKRSAAAPRVVAQSFLRENAQALGIDPNRIDQTLELLYEKESPSGTHVRWVQVMNGVQVYRSDIVVKVSKQGDVSSVQNNLRMGPVVRTTPTISADRAVKIGLAAVRPTGKAIGDFKADLRVVNFDSGPELAYLVSIPVESPMGDWLVYVDASSGNVRGVVDQMVYATGSGRVFDPDPESKTGNTSLPDNADANTGIPFPGAYDIRTLLDITNTAGTFSLSGPFARIIEFEAPVVAPITATHPDSFLFQRQADAFEDVLVYFHIDQTQRYIQSLGFTNANNRIQELDSHGLSGADNSHYVLSSTRIAFGDGGVDDAEDADIVVHEYGHSIQHNIVPGWGGGQEGAMGEGFGDYLAGSYSRTLYPLHEPNFVFNWDGHNEFWPGRLLIDPSLHYPEDANGEVHDSGTLWCSGLMDAWGTIGRPVMDRLVIDHHFGLGGTATMADAAAQIIQSDFDLYGGAHVGQLVAVFDFWGFVNAEDFIPSITHTPLADTENTAGPYVVTATITSAQPLVTSSLKVFYGTTGTFTDSLLLTPAGPPNTYSASIPGPLSNVTVRYYLAARDSAGGAATHPAGAPGSFHTFFVGTDVTPPVIVHAPIGNYPRLTWPATVNAVVTDNIAVNHDSVRVNWAQNGNGRQPFYLTRVGLTTSYSGTFPSDTTQVTVGDLITYRISARDVAGTPNIALSPPGGDASFTLIASRGTILVLDDDEVASHQTIKVLSPEDVFKGGSATIEESARQPDGIHSASDMTSLLNTMGFTATLQAAATSNPATWSGYGLVISSSGANLSPVALPAYRTALESYVAGGGKLLVEGGEVVYDATTSPIYPTFAANVLHSSDWDADNAGALTLLAAQTGHPIATTPNALPASMAIAYAGFGDEDSYKPDASSYIVYGVTAQAGNGGILVYDNTVSPQSAQIVVFGFDFKKVATAPVRTAMLENTVEYLLRAESPPTGSLAGRVQLAGQTSNAGATVTLSPGGASVVTDSTGFYTIPGLFAGTYSVTAAKTGFATSVLGSVAVATATTTNNVNFILYPQQQTADCLSPGTAIPDNNPTGISSNLVVVPAFAVQSVKVSVNIPHTYMGDLIVELRHGAKSVRLHNRTGGTAENIVRTYPPATVDGPGTLADFVGDPSNGTWTLFISDNEGADLGNLANWCLYLTGPVDSSAVVSVGDGGDTGSQAWLAYSEPNPMRSSGTTIRFSLPTAEQASLTVYDIAGRKVRALVEGFTAAGQHQVRWDGRDASGRSVRAGVYLYRLRSGAFDKTRRLVVVQ